jgi:hypothetical protein
LNRTKSRKPDKAAGILCRNYAEVSVLKLRHSGTAGWDNPVPGYDNHAKPEKILFFD